MSSLLTSSVAVQPGLCQTRSETKTMVLYDAAHIVTGFHKLWKTLKKKHTKRFHAWKNHGVCKKLKNMDFEESVLYLTNSFQASGGFKF